MKRKLAAALTAMLLITGIAISGCGGGSSSTDLGKKGEPVNLVIGYAPYFTEVWSSVVMREKEFWKQHLPKGSTVEFQIGLQGSIIIGQMLAGKQQVGYVGDMPSIVGASKRAVKPLEIVATTTTSADSCGVFLVANSAPQFKTQAEAIKWMNGKAVATPQGSCADRVAQAAFEKEGVKPGEYLNQSLELVTSRFENDSIDAGIVWEPVAAKLVDDGLARRVASGQYADLTTASFVVMSEQLVKERPDIAEGWLAAELQAQKYMSDPANRDEIAKMALKKTEGYTESQMYDALFTSAPEAIGGAPDGTKVEFPFALTPEVRELIKSSSDFLYKIKAIDKPQLPASAINGKLAQAVLKREGGAPKPLKGTPAGAR